MFSWRFGPLIPINDGSSALEYSAPADHGHSSPSSNSHLQEDANDPCHKVKGRLKTGFYEHDSELQ